MKKHAIKTCQTAYFELKCIVQSTDFSLKMQPHFCDLLYPHCLITVTVFSWVHPSLVLQPLQKVQNFAARLILMAPHHHHSTPLLQKLHWLSISERVKYKVACMCFHVLNGASPTDLSELLHIYTLSYTLCSSSDSCMLKIQQYQCKTHGFHTLTYFRPHIWNSLPQDIRHCSTLPSRKTKLKAFFFSQYFHSS